MKDASKEILAAAIGIATGSALGILLTKYKNYPPEHKSGNSSCQNRKRERLFFVKNKMEMHRERLDRHLSRINAKIESLSTGEPVGTATREPVLFKPDRALI
jgi:hypothetical protein